ncbi:MAG: hypothetical protein ACRBF0_00505 [Calditrichia bacterium]
MSNSLPIRILYFCLFYSLSIWGQEQADFLLIESPSELVIYNKYEQAITTSEQRLFASYIPLQLQEKETMLSDAFTPASKIKVGRDIFFLVKESAETYRNQEKAGSITVLRNVEIVTDSLQILDVSGLQTNNIPGASSKSFDLQNDQQLQRLLRYRGYSFVQTLGIPTRFGWVKLPNRPGRIWKGVKAAKRTTDIATIRAGIERSVSEANAVYAKLYEHFNRKHNKTLSAPQWQLNSADKSSLLIHLFPESTASASTNDLMEKLQRSLAGSLFSATLVDSGILIEPKSGGAGK